MLKDKSHKNAGCGNEDMLFLQGTQVEETETHATLLRSNWEDKTAIYPRRYVHTDLRLKQKFWCKSDFSY